MINRQDVEHLKKSPNVANRTNVAQKVGILYTSSSITETQRELAEDIFRLLIHDTEIKVRQALVETLRNARHLPHDIITAIIHDIDSIALPFIQYSVALSDDDLLAILDMSEVKRQKAVAKRQTLSSTIADAIAEKCSDEVIAHLLTNQTSDIATPTYEKIIKKYPRNELIYRSMVYRNNLPFEITEKIISRISYKLKMYLVLNHNLPQNFASDLIDEIKEKLTLKISDDYSQDTRISDFVRHLHKSGHLTPSLVTRAICSGDLLFFEHALGYLSDTSVNNVRKILYTSSADFEIRNLLRKALLPKSTFPIIFNALKIIRDIHFDCNHYSNKTFSRKIIERILSFAPSTEEMANDDIDYLISKIS